MRHVLKNLKRSMHLLWTEIIRPGWPWWLFLAAICAARAAG